MTGHSVGTVAGIPVAAGEIDAREAALRAGRLAAALPLAGTSEGRQLRRWLTQLAVTERVVAVDAAARGVVVDRSTPTEEQLLPDVTARLEIGSIATAALNDPLARALFVHVTAGVTAGDDDIRSYHTRNPSRFAQRRADADGWHTTAPADFDEVRPAVAAHLTGAARRRAFRIWLDARRAELVELAPGYEHPGDPRQPDNTHKH